MWIDPIHPPDAIRSSSIEFIVITPEPLGMVRSTQYDFSGSVALVTGAAGALGSAVSEAFRDAGATVAAIDRSDPDEEEILLDLTDRISYYQADLADEPTVSSTVDRIIDDHGRADVLANIVGTWRGGHPIHETEQRQFDLLVDVNLRTMFLTSKHAIPHLQETNGSIISVASRSSLKGGANDGPYRAAKAGVRILTESIAAELLGTVRANVVLPSTMDTPMNRAMMDPKEEWVDPADVAEVILFLASDAATVTSGASVPVYGQA